MLNPMMKDNSSTMGIIGFVVVRKKMEIMPAKKLIAAQYFGARKSLSVPNINLPIALPKPRMPKAVVAEAKEKPMSVKWLTRC